MRWRWVAGLAVIAGFVVTALWLRPASEQAVRTAASRTDARTDVLPPRPESARRVEPSDRDESARAQPPDPDEMATPWAAVDLNALRVELPDNLYWKMAVPTKDPAVLEARAAERERWNAEYGKILSNTATPDEIDTYYAHRYRLSSDYVQFATYLLADYGDELEARDVGLLKVAIELHMARLEEIPRQIAEAHERCAAHEVVRREWLESQKAFNGEKSD